MEEKAYAVITKDSVRLMAEMAGYSNVSEEVAALLGEDVTYRLRETVMKSAAFMKNAKRRRLCPEDFNQALRDAHVQAVYGQSSTTDSTPFRQTREGDLHFVEDHDVNFNNIVCNSYVPKSLGKASIKGQWLAVEGVSKLQSSSHSMTSLQNTYKNMKKELPDELMNYYSHITRALVGSRTVLVKWALEDLSTNVSVVPLLTYFVNFISSGVKAVSHDIVKLTLLMRTVEALVSNQALFLEIQPYLSLLVQAVENCLLEPLAAYISQQSMDHWMLRQFAARLLAQLVRKWDTPKNGLHSSVVDRLSETLQDLSRPACSHYGAIMGLVALGPAEVEKVLIAQLPVLMPHLHTSLTDPKPSSVQRQDALRVLSALQLAAEKLVKSGAEGQALCEDSEHSRPAVNGHTGLQHGQDRLSLYQKLYDSFGDVLAAKLPVTKLDKVFDWQPSSDCISLGNSDSKRSGEELLSDLMQQVKQEEEAQQQKQRRIMQSDKLPAAYPADSIAKGLVHLASSKQRLSDNPGDSEQGSGFQEQLAVSSTISDPSKGTLKLKIKRHMQGQGSPSQPRLTLQINKTRTDLEQQQLSRDNRDKEYRHKRKRKQSSRNPWEQEGQTSDVEDSYNTLLGVNQQTAAYSPGEESSNSDSNPHKKGKLTLKLKVPSKEATSE